jgi:hypothetical protein
VREFSSKAKSAEDTNPLTGFKFKLDATEFECKGRLSVLDLSDLARRVGTAGGENANPEDMDPDQMAAVVGSMAESLLMAMGTREYERLRKHIRANETPDSIVIEIMQMVNEQIQSVTEAEAGRPTEPSSPSSTGRAATDERISRIISFQSGDVRVLPPPEDHKQPKAKGTARPRRTAARGQQAAG